MDKATIPQEKRLSDSRSPRGGARGLAHSWPLLLCLLASCATTGNSSEGKAPEQPRTVYGSKPKGPLSRERGVTNPTPPPAEGPKKMDGEEVYFISSDGKYTLDIDSEGWAYFSTNTKVFARFTHFDYQGMLYLVYRNKDSDYDGYYLSYNDDEYVGAFTWKYSVPWTLDKEHLAPRDRPSWNCYQYKTDQNSKVWVAVGEDQAGVSVNFQEKPVK